MSAESAIQEITKSSAAIKAAERREIKALSELMNEFVSILNSLRSAIVAHKRFFGQPNQATQLVALRQNLQKANQTLVSLEKLNDSGSEGLKKIAWIGHAMYNRLSVFEQALSRGDIDSYVKAVQQYHFSVEELEKELTDAFSRQINLDRLRLAE